MTTYEIVKSRYGYRLDSIVPTDYGTARNYVAQHHDLQFLKRLANKLTPDADVHLPRDYWP